MMASSPDPPMPNLYGVRCPKVRSTSTDRDKAILKQYQNWPHDDPGSARLMQVHTRDEPGDPR